MGSAQDSTAKVLVVDDDAVSRQLLGHALLAGGFQPILSSNGEHALLALIKQRGDIEWLFTKLQLPGFVCGAILAEEFHRAKPGRAVIYASSPQLALLLWSKNMLSAACGGSHEGTCVAYDAALA